MHTLTLLYIHTYRHGRRIHWQRARTHAHSLVHQLCGRVPTVEDNSGRPEIPIVVVVVVAAVVVSRRVVYCVYAKIMLCYRPPWCC